MSTNRHGWLLGGAVATAAMLAATTAALARPSGGSGGARVAIRDQQTLGVNNWGLEITNYGSFGYDISGSDAGGEFPRGSGHHVLFAGGFQFGTLVDSSPQVSQVEFDSEYQPGAITNGPAAVADLTADDPGGADQVVLEAAKGASLPSGWPEGLDVIGDGATYATFNDLDVGLSSDDGQRPLGIEVSQHAFAFAKQGAQGDIVYLRFFLTNYSDQDYVDSYAEVWFDPDNGSAGNDLTGSDVETSLGYVYNADEEDRNTAMGADFFQGPIVDDSTSTVVQRGRVTFNKDEGYEPVDGDVEIENKRVLGMSAFSFYINGTDPDDDTQRYNLMKGLTRDGDARPNGPFDYAGDPVTGEGVNDGAPNDKRMALITGPFTLASGESQEIVVAIIGSEVTTSDDPLVALTAVRETDREAQIAYNFNYIQQSAPLPPLTQIEAYDTQVTLTWDDSPESEVDRYGLLLGLGEVRTDTLGMTEIVVGYDTLGVAIIDTVYETETAGYDSLDFQGYRVYRSETGESGDWELLAEYDKVDGVAEVRNRVFNNTLQEYEITQLHIGTDSGLRYFYVDDGLTNGQVYHYAVTSYDYQPAEFLERTLESPLGQNELVIVPKEAPAGWAVATVSAQEDTAIHVEGTSDGVVTYQMVRPELLTGETYAVTFNADDTWMLTNTSAGDTIYDAVADQDGNPSTKMVDGFIMRVVNPPFHPREVISGAPEDTTAWWTGVNWGGAVVGGGMDYGHYFFDSELDPADVHEVQIDFTTDPAHYSKAVTYRRDLGYVASGVGTFPGEIWDMDVDPPRRLNVCFVEYEFAGKAANLHWDPESSADNGSYDYTREYLFIMNSDYTETPDAVYDDVNWGPAADVIYAWWPDVVAGRSFEDIESDMTLIPNRVNTPADTFEFVPEISSTFASADAEADLDDIRVVPNPYYATSDYDETQFDRRVKFFGLPEECTIRIFNVAGDLVRTLEHNAGSDNDRTEDGEGNGPETTTSIEGWDLKNEGGFWAASGVYVAHIDAPNIGTTFVKFAIIQGTEELGVF